MAIVPLTSPTAASGPLAGVTKPILIGRAAARAAENGMTETSADAPASFMA